MAHFGIITPPVPGHLHPFGAIGRTLIKRGHRVTVFQMPELEADVHAEGLAYYALGKVLLPSRFFADFRSRIGDLKGLAAFHLTLDSIQKTTEMFFQDAPAALRECGIDVLLVDQTEASGGTIADHLGIPYVTICNALVINHERQIPPVFTSWGYNPSAWGQARNWLGYRLWDFLMRPLQQSVNKYRKQWDLPAQANADDYFSTLAQISQQPRSFDFPRKELPAHFHYVGPFRDKRSEAISFPWEQLNGRPLIYASLGTLQNRSFSIFQCIAEACAGLPVQLVISHGRVMTDEQIKKLPGNPLVVPYAPQQAVLAKARLAISHAGLNTVLDSLSQGVPLVAIPLTYEQPGIAARLQWAKVGRVVPLKTLEASTLRTAIQDVLANESYRERAQQMALDIHRVGGAERAADIIETVTPCHRS